MRSIRARLLVMLLAGLVAVLLLGGAGVYSLVRSQLLAELDASLDSRARSLAALVFMEHGEIEIEFDEQLGASIGAVFSVAGPDGVILACSPALADHPLPGLLSPGETAAWADVELPEDTDGRAISIAFFPRADEEIQGSDTAPAAGLPRLVATVAVSRETTDQALATVLGAIALVGAVLVAATIALVWIGVRVGLAPLDRLSARLRTIDAARIDTRVDAAGAAAELRPVYDELNRLLARVGEAIARERRFTDAAAHELRTPLAELRATAEVALRWPDDERPVQALRESVAIAGEMEQLVESLLLMSRGDAIAIDDAAPRPIAPIVEKCLDGIAESAASRTIAVHASLAPDARWRIPEHAAETIIRNLIDNAAQYTPPGGSITVELTHTPESGSRLSIANTPVAITAEQIPYLTEPLWRADPARSERTHLGIGLTIVSRFAHAAGLALDISLQPSATLRVCVADTMACVREERP